MKLFLRWTVMALTLLAFVPAAGVLAEEGDRVCGQANQDEQLWYVQGWYENGSGNPVMGTMYQGTNAFTATSQCIQQWCGGECEGIET